MIVGFTTTYTAPLHQPPNCKIINKFIPMIENAVLYWELNTNTSATKL
jgi:hypothetical protein